MKYLDIEAFLRKQIMFDILLKTVFTKTEKFLIKKNKYFSIYKPSSASSDDENQLPEYFNTRSKYFQKLFDDTKLEDPDTPIPAVNDISNYSINSNSFNESVLAGSR